jgi:hypothetical protein
METQKLLRGHEMILYSKKGPLSIDRFFPKIGQKMPFILRGLFFYIIKKTAKQLSVNYLAVTDLYLAATKVTDYY